MIYFKKQQKEQVHGKSLHEENCRPFIAGEIGNQWRSFNDGRWAAVEVKLGAKEIEQAVIHLLELKNKIDIEKMQEPSFLMVLTGGEVAYRRNDGVFVVPIGCLKD